MTTPTPARDVDLLEAIAVHEVGHALLASVFGIRTRDIHVHRSWDGGTWGGTEVYDWAEPSRERALMLLGGVRASAMWLQREHHHPSGFAVRWGHDSGCNDLREFRKLGVPLGPAVREVDAVLGRYYPRLVRAAGVVVARRRLRVERLKLPA